MKKFLTGLLICTLFVALGAAAATADPYCGFEDIEGAVASADYLELSKFDPNDNTDPSVAEMLGYEYYDAGSCWKLQGYNKLENIDPTLVGFYSEFEFASGDFEPATLTLTFTGELDANGRFTDDTLGNDGTLYAEFPVVSSTDIANMGLSSNDFYYVFADGVEVVSDDVANGITFEVPVAEDGIALFPADQVITVVLVENEDVEAPATARAWVNGWKLDLVYDDHHTCATEEQARAEVAETAGVDSSDIFTFRPFGDDTTDYLAFETSVPENGHVRISYTGPLNADGTIADLRTIMTLANIMNGMNGRNADGLPGGGQPLRFDEETGMFYLRVMTKNPFAFHGEPMDGMKLLQRYLECSLYINGEESSYVDVAGRYWAEFTNLPGWNAFALFVPVAERVGETGNATYKLCQPENLPWDVELVWGQQEGPNDLTYTAQKYQLTYRVDVQENDLEDFLFTGVTSDEQPDAEDLADAINEEGALFDIWTSEDIIAMGTFNVASDSPVNINLASDDIEGASEVLFEFSNTASGDVTSMDFAYTAIFSEDALRFDIFVPKYAKDLLEADTDGEPTFTVTFTVEDITDLQIIMGGKDVTEFAEIVGNTVTLVFTKDGDLTFSNLSGTIFEMEAVPSDPIDPEEHTGSSSSGCSVGSIAPFALLLLAPLALLRK